MLHFRIGKPFEGRADEQANLFWRLHVRKIVGMLFLMVGLSAFAMADDFNWFQHPVPEIDPSSGVSAAALLSGAVMMIRGRKKQ